MEDEPLASEVTTAAPKPAPRFAFNDSVSFGDQTTELITVTIDTCPGYLTLTGDFTPLIVMSYALSNSLREYPDSNSTAQLGVNAYPVAPLMEKPALLDNFRSIPGEESFTSFKTLTPGSSRA